VFFGTLTFDQLNIEKMARKRERRYESRRERERKNPERYIEFKRNER
jgi:hypothetical protein